MSAFRQIMLISAAIAALGSFNDVAFARDLPKFSRPRTTHATDHTPSASPSGVQAPSAATTSAKPAATTAVPAKPSQNAPAKIHAGQPALFPVMDHQSSGSFSSGWLHITTTYAGNPPTLPAQGAVTISSVRLQGVYLGSAFASTNASDVTTLETFLKDVAGSSYVTSLSPYGASAGTAVAGKVINVALPLHTSASPTYVQDLDILNYLATNINNGTLVAPNSSTVYMVYVEPGVAIKAGNATSIRSFLGYHNVGQFTGTGGATETVCYAVMPYPGSPNPTPASQSPTFLTAIDELTAVSSHEIAESITDPDTVNGWQETLKETVTVKFLTWTLFKFTFPLTGEEIGDVPLILNNYSSACFARLNGHLIQKVIAPDGVSMITPTGSVATQ
jgi:biotin carboxyl carrier protein